MVLESVKVDPVHRLAQLQVGDYQRTHYLGIGHYVAVVLLRRSWLFRKEDDGRLRRGGS